MNIYYEIFPAVLNMSITASVAVVVIVILRKIFKDMPKVIFYAMWAIVLLRLLCPVSIPSDFAFLNIFEMPTYTTGPSTNRMEFVPQDIVHNEYPEVNLPLPLVDQIINHFIPQGEEQIGADPLKAPVAIATNIWIVGIALMAGYAVVSYITLRRKLVGAVKQQDNIYICDYINSPFVIGVFRPRIYLPSTLAENEQKYIVMHEKYHIKRLDHIVKLIAFAGLTLHWFNPFVWLCFDLLCKDMEMSCDEAVVNRLGCDIKADYSNSLLNLATDRYIFAGAPLAFGEGDTSQRITNIYHMHKPKAVVFAAVAVLFAVVGISLLLNPDTARGQIYCDGTLYIQSGKAQSGGIEGSRNVGAIKEIYDSNHHLTENLTAKNIDENLRYMDVFRDDENQYKLWLTTGKGWVPFVASGMSEETSDSWIEIKETDNKADVTFSLDENVNELAVYEDIYEYGKLISTSLVLYSNINDGEDFIRHGRNLFSATFDFNENRMSFVTEYPQNGVSSIRYVELPHKDYNSYMYRGADTDGKEKLLANDSIDLLYIFASSYDDGRIYTNHENAENDIVVIYRFVTRSKPTR